MKKITIAFILCLLASGLMYADDRFNLTMEWMADSVYVRRYFGGYTDKEETGASSPYMYQGDGITNFFQTSMFGEGIKGRVGFDITGEKMGGSFLLRITEDTSYDEPVEWSSWIKFGGSSFNMRLLAGNNEQKGRIGDFGIMFPVWRKQGNYVANNFFATTINFPYGYANPNKEMGFVEFYMTETSDVFMPAGANARKLINFMMDFNFTPLTITLAAGGLYANDSVPITNIFKNARGELIRDTLYDAVYDPAILGGMNYAVRLESAKIANLITVGAAYKHTSSVFTKIFPPEATVPYDPLTIIDENKSNHAYGLFALIEPSDTFSVSAGYSGLQQTWTNPQYVHTFIDTFNIHEHGLSDHSEAIHPIFHGVDLNFAYTGIQKLTLSLNNNVSFARINGISTSEKEEGKFSLGWAYREKIGNQADDDGTGRHEQYIGIANVLGIRYAISDRFSVNTNFSSRLGIFTLYGYSDENPESYSHYFNIRAGAGYTIFDSPGVKGIINFGFNMRLMNFLYQNGNTLEKFTAGLVEMAVPISFSLRY